jgi:hypothetical protein
MREGRKRWVKRMKVAGLPLGCGRKKGRLTKRQMTERALIEGARREALGPAGRAYEDMQLACARATTAVDQALGIRV